MENVRGFPCAALGGGDSIRTVLYLILFSILLVVLSNRISFSSWHFLVMLHGSS